MRVIDAGRMRLAFLPSVGGRLISLRVEERELLWRNPTYLDNELRVVIPREQWPRIDGTFASWVNLGGSKSWPAPQGWSGEGQWPGPPDELIDAGAWTWNERWEAGVLVVEMTSPDDPRTGLRITRRFHIQPDSLGFDSEIEHLVVGDRPRSWAPWEICQVDTSGAIGVPGAGVRVSTAGQRPPLHQGDWWGQVILDEWSDHVVIPAQEAVGKRGFTDATGHVAWFGHDGSGLRLSFQPDLGAEYPDGGARVEVWMQSPIPSPIAELGGLHPDAHLAELEVLGPLTTLTPGETATLRIRWDVAPPGGSPTFSASPGASVRQNPLAGKDPW